MAVELLRKTTEIIGVAATEDRDNQQEILKLSGADISQMVEKGSFNDNHGTGFLNTLGKITEAKKIMSEGDAVSPYQKKYWEQYKRPFLFVKGYLFDDAETDHPNAKSVAAVMHAFKKNRTPAEVKMSVEGKVLDRGYGGLIKESMIRNVALTLVPANPHTTTSVLTKSMGTTFTMDSMEVVDPSLESILNKIEDINQLIKMLSAGYGGTGTPASQTGGSALIGEPKKNIKIGSKNLPAMIKVRILKTLIKSALDQKVPLADAISLSLQVFNQRFQD